MLINKQLAVKMNTSQKLCLLYVISYQHQFEIATKYNEHCVSKISISDMARDLGIDKSHVHKHIKILESAGMINTIIIKRDKYILL